MAKGPSYRKRQFMNFWKTFLEENKAVNFCFKNMTTKNKIDVELFQIGRKKSTKTKRQRKNNIKMNSKPRLQNQYWMTLTLKIYILTLEVHRRFDAVTVDKASNNFFLFVKNATWKGYCLKFAWTIILQLKKLLHKRSCKCQHYLM